MKFRARLATASTLLRVILLLEKSSKLAYLKLTPQTTWLIVRSDVLDATQIWFEASTSRMFGDVKLSSACNNTIVLECDLSQLAKALKPAQSHGSETEIKLAKKEGIACLTVTAKSHRQSVVYDSPVRVLTPSEWAPLEEPQLPQPAIQLTMPALRDMKAIVDKLRGAAQTVTLKANIHAELCIAVETDALILGTVFRDLELISTTGRPSQHQLQHAGSSSSASTKEVAQKDVSSSNPQANLPQQQWESKVDVKKLARFLQAHALQPARCVISLVPDRCVVLHLFLADESMYCSFFLPVYQT
jgi:hypothetical protein